MRNATVEQRYYKRLQSVGEFLEGLGAGLGCKGLVGGVLQDVRIRLGTAEDPGVLLIVRATDGADQVVGFCGGSSVTEALLAWRQKDSAVGLKWRPNVPWSERVQGD